VQVSALMQLLEQSAQAVHLVSFKVAFSKFKPDPALGNVKRKNHSYGLLAWSAKDGDRNNTGSVSDPSPRFVAAPCPVKMRTLVVAASDCCDHITISSPF
jgi:hypothetical protein